VFPVLAAAITRDKKKGYTPIPVTVDGLTSTLQKYYGFVADGTGNRGIPRSDWIHNALEKLDSLRMAHRTEAAGSYVIRYKTLQGDILQRLGRLCYEQDQKKKSKGKKPDTRQRTLVFDDQ
jgi:hypothetical protein